MAPRAHGVAPTPEFLGHHAGLAVLGQGAIDGVPLRARTTARPGCPHARAATGCLLAVGAATADRDVASSADVAGALRTLLDRFAELYRPSHAEYAALSTQIAAVARSADPFPVVMQHGDPGVWNVLIAAGDRPVFLDWEAAEEHGMPLWDVFYLARSVAVTVARAAGTRDALRGFSEQVLAGGPLGDELAADVDRHCADIGLDRALVEPLFLTCWMHRALKEAMRLRPGELHRSRYAALLRLCLARREAPGLRRLFAA